MSMTRTFRFLPRLTHGLPALALCAAMLAGPPPALAQGAFAPAVLVNDRAITTWELEQYIGFLTILGQPGDVPAIAEERLIEDRLRLDAAAALGLTVSPQAVEAGMAEFAGRAELTTEEFLAAIGQAGVEPATFRAFVEAGLVWRDVIRARFGPRVVVTDAEVQRALALAQVEGGLRVLLSEIVLPAETPEARATARLVLGRMAGREMTEAQFSARATEISAAASRTNGGKLEWLPLEGLPAEAQAVVRRTAPGTTTQPVDTETSVVLFQVRDTRTVSDAEARTTYLDWAEVAVADAGDGARVAAMADTCGDLYGVAPDTSETALRRSNLPESQVPADLAATLAAMDVNDTAIIVRGGAPVLVMLCRRGFGTGEEGTRPTEAQVREQLVNRRLAAMADSYMAELKAEASIRRP